ncbi:hypothetical protein [Rhizobium sp. AAP43]|uniref:hypothetical protein n=1 Tax=Rhizobium sp. AAP43 TaxID=1523420 RepID=UPI0006B9FAE5|nr:hypothetical protein [Rhizobium sp. AAP43]KPF47082.1 hypothetical protein IP76_01935 [Rhizobium sp. AAP43]
MTDHLDFNRQDLALFLTASIRQAGHERAFFPLGDGALDLGRVDGERREEMRIRRYARVSPAILALALSGEGTLREETQAALWLALGINPDIRRDTRELQKFKASGRSPRRPETDGKVAA